MKPHRLGAVALALTLAVPAAPAFAEEPLFYLLSGSSLECLKTNAAAYATGTDETVFITVADCGTARMGPLDLASQVVNSAPDIAIAADDGPDSVIALAQEDFTCLSSLDIPKAAPLVAYFPEDCGVEIRD